MELLREVSPKTRFLSSFQHQILSQTAWGDNLDFDMSHGPSVLGTYRYSVASEAGRSASNGGSTRDGGTLKSGRVNVLGHERI